MTVTGLEGITDFREFSLERKEASHTVCTFTAGKKTYDLSDRFFRSKLKIFDQDCQLVMTGLPSQVRYTKGYSENQIQVSMISQSAQLEEQKATRIFQNADQTYRDVLRQVAKADGFEVIFTEEGIGTQALGRAVVQLNETTMDFIRRAAMDMDTFVWIDDKSDGIYQIRLGRHRDGAPVLIEEDSLLVQERELTQEKEWLRFRIHADDPAAQRLDIGKRAGIAGREYIVCALAIEKSRQEYRYTYTAVRSSKKQNNAQKNVETKPLHRFLGKVVSNRDEERRGRVQVDFSSVEVTDLGQKKIWIDVATIYDGEQGGVIFLPDEGDFVDVLWDGTSFLVTGTRRMQSIASEHWNPEEKCMVDKSGSKLCFAKGTIAISGRTVEIN